MAPLTLRRQRFVTEYVRDLNATQAAIRAGYSKSGARTEGARLLANADVQHALGLAQRDLAERSAVDADRILAEYARIGFADVAEYASLMTSDDVDAALRELPVGASRAISELTVDTYVEGRGAGARDVRRVKMKFHSKIAALDSLSKHLGLFAADRGAGAPVVPDTSAVKDWSIAKLVAGIAVMKQAELGPVVDVEVRELTEGTDQPDYEEGAL